MSLHRFKPLQRISRLRPRGKRAWRAPEPAGEGRCRYCGKWGPRTWDHVLQQSLFPEFRYEPRNRVEACWPCNSGRGAGKKPWWNTLPLDTRLWVLEQIGPFRAARHFQGVPQPAEEAS